MAEVDSSLVYTGFWINHDQGPVLGSTITIRQQVAYTVVALIAIVVATAAASAWNLVLFVAHQTRATSQPRDGIFRQQQILFRSLSPPGTILTDSIKMLLACRSHNSRDVVRCLLPALFGLGFALASVAAGVFSSFIVNTTDCQVLLHDANCRVWNDTAFRSIADTAQKTVLNSVLAEKTTTYAQQCYANASVPSQCHSYVQPRIEVTISQSECPFAASACNNTGEAIILDTGYLDSHITFGINAKPQDRVQFRRKVTCAPLTVKDYIAILEPSEIDFEDIARHTPLIDEKVLALRYGPRKNGFRFGNASSLQSTFTSATTLRYTFEYVRGNAYDTRLVLTFLQCCQRLRLLEQGQQFRAT